MATIHLPDLTEAAIQYVHQFVTCTIDPPTPDVPNALSPGEGFTTNISVRNAAAPDGVRLIDVVYELKSEPRSVVKFVVPATPPARSGADPSSAALTPGAPVTEMFLVPKRDALEVGDLDEIKFIRGVAKELGKCELSVRVHARVDVAALFPTSSNQPGTTSVKVV